MLQNNSSIKKQRRNVKIISFLSFVGGQILNYMIIEPSLNYLTNMTNSSTIVHGFGILITVLFVGYLIWKLYQWHKEDERLKREDFIDKLTEILKAQKRLTENSIGNHVKGLRDEFITPLKDALKKDELDKKKIEELLDYEFNHYQTAFNEDIGDLIKRLERHKTDEILDDIRYEKAKENRNK